SPRRRRASPPRSSTRCRPCPRRASLAQCARARAARAGGSAGRPPPSRASTRRTRTARAGPRGPRGTPDGFRSGAARPRRDGCRAPRGDDRVSRPRMFEPLRIRDFALLWTGMTVSLVGDSMFIVVLAWQTYDLSSSPASLGWIVAAYTAPTVVFLLVG